MFYDQNIHIQVTKRSFLSFSFRPTAQAHWKYVLQPTFYVNLLKCTKTLT